MNPVVALWMLAAAVAFVVIVGEWSVRPDCPHTANVTTIVKDQSRVGQ